MIRRMIYSIFQFGETLCREIMVRGIDVLALDVNTTLQEAMTELVPIRTFARARLRGSHR